MRDTTVLPAFRSPELRDLVREAIQHGALVRLSGGGHVLVTNPETGTRVSLSTTARTARMGHTLGNSRRSLERAGLLASRHRQEVRDMTVSAEEEVPTTVHNRPGASVAGGKYAITSREVVTIRGREVKVDQRADGQWVAQYREPEARKGWRQAYDTTRDGAIAKITAAMDTPLVPRGKRSDTGKPKATAPVNGVDHNAPEVRQAQGLDPIRPAHRSPMAAAVLASLDDPEEFPLVAALAALDETLTPALVALEAAGKVDAAGLLREELVRSPLEEEALALYRRVRRGG